MSGRKKEPAPPNNHSPSQNNTTHHTLTQPQNRQTLSTSVRSHPRCSPPTKKKWVPKFYFPLLALPAEIVFVIVSFLTPSDLCRIARVCIKLKDLSRMSWKPLCEREYEFTGMLNSQDINWQEYFYLRKQISSPKKNAFVWSTPEVYGDRPSPRMALSGVAVGTKIVYIGGQLEDYVRYDDIYFFDTETMRFTKPIIQGNPPKFARHVAVAIEQRVFVFGGFNGFGVYYSLAVLDTEKLTWTYPETHGTAPIPRTNHAAAAVGDKMYIYGGNYTPVGTADEEYTVLGDLFVLNTTTMTWSEPTTYGTHPGPRTAHTLLAVGSTLYLFGGGIWQPKPDRWIKKFNDIYHFDTKRMLWTKIRTSGEIPICSFPISFTVHHWIFFFGGQKITEHYITNKMYYYDTVCGMCHELIADGETPKPRDLGTASFIGDRAYMFAGSSGVPVNDLDVLTWMRTTALPSNNADA
eukprot:TRINITY_DN10789_c0_g1_i1.p1 TRINITY_DN10789_c0_g1~~TRINITY_DN10789_c0_g1_i1.p1  ORF type:complete len:464 (+),score=54.88 TRINITY_DN10789_c0_g1_i1:65-1456(+)